MTNPQLGTKIWDQAADFRRVAWIRMGALGDLLVGTASLFETYQRCSAAEITVIGPSLWLQLLSPLQFPRIKEVFVVAPKQTRGEVFTATDGQWQKQKTMELKTYLRGVELCVNTHVDSFRYAWPAFQARVPIRVGSGPWPAGEMLYTHHSPWLGKDPLIHERDRALFLLDAPPRHVCHWPQSTLARQKQIPDFLQNSPTVQAWHSRRGLPVLKTAEPRTFEKLMGFKEKDFLLINPTSSRIEKAWPAENFKELTGRLAEACPSLEVFMIGSPNESKWLQQVAGTRFQIIQPPQIGDLIDIVAAAKLLITNTSSVQFLAATTCTPTLTLMGRSRPEIWGPLGKADKVIRGKINPSLSADIFAQEFAAYQSISVGEVFQVASDMLGLET